jgi:3-polyprenyl-4-hydroxybenzoate decarboxylase
MHAFRILRSRMFAVVVLAGALFASACATSPPPRQVDRVLFVGNSLTYVGNLPAVFEALSNANGMPVASDMIVQGGATLAQRLDDGSVAQALAMNR